MRYLPHFQEPGNTGLCHELIHTAAVAAYAIEADLIGARVDDEQAGVLTFAGELLPTGQVRPKTELDDWPLRFDAAWLDRFAQSDESGVSRLKSYSVEDRLEFAACFRPIDPYGGVTDALCLRLALANDAACSVVYLRCGDHPPFGGNNMWMLRHLTAVIRADTQHAYSQWKRQVAWTSNDRLGPIPSKTSDLNSLIARLSKTERVVLNHLRTWDTERDIARAIGRSPHTVHVHVKSIYRKLMVTSRKQLLAVIKPAHDPPAASINPGAYKSDHG